jgi:hypothetical protein
VEGGTFVGATLLIQSTLRVIIPLAHDFEHTLLSNNDKNSVGINQSRKAKEAARMKADREATMDRVANDQDKSLKYMDVL